MRPRSDKFRVDPPAAITRCLVLELSQVGHGRDRNDRVKQIGGHHTRLQGGVTAIRPAQDRQLPGVRSLRNQPAARIRHVSDGRPPRLEAIVLIPLIAIASGSAIIGLDDRVAALRKILRQPIEPPFVACRRPTVRHNDRRQALHIGTRGRQGQVRRNLGPVGSGIIYRLYARKLQIGERFARQQQRAQFLGSRSEKIINSWIGISLSTDDIAAFIGRGIDHHN